MKNLLIVYVLLSMYLSADVIMKKALEEDPEISWPIEKPIRPIHPVRPVINTGIVYQDNYYNENYQTSCDEYLKIIAQKDETILALKQEIEALKRKEQQELQQSLKVQYDAQMKKFEKSKSSIKTNNSITISEEPIE